MEVFEIKKQCLEREASVASNRISGRSKVGYILTMAGIILFTMALLVVLHFSREYSFLSDEIAPLQENSAGTPEKLERQRCEEPYCSTKECVSVASNMLESMNFKGDPCTNFYDYACGGYPRVKAVPYAMDFQSPVKDAQFEVLIRIPKIMENPPSENEIPVLQKYRRFYNSCISTNARNELENKTLSFWFQDLGLVPEDYVLGNPLDFDQELQWTMLVSKLEEYRIHTLFKPHFIEKADHTAPEKMEKISNRLHPKLQYGCNVYKKDSLREGRMRAYLKTILSMEVDCRVPFLKSEAYLNTTDDELAYQLVMYKEMMSEALEGLKMDRETRKEFMEDVLKLETDIATAILNVDLSSAPELTDENKQLLKDIWRPAVSEAVQDMDLVSSCDYDLQTILTVLNQASNKNVIKYVTWRMLMQLMQYMGTGFRELHLHYMSKLPDTDYAFESKWKQCADVARTELGLVATRSLMDNGYLKRDLLNKINEEFLEIKRNIALVFTTVGGMNDNVAKMFSDKLKGMKLTTGYSEIANENGSLDSLYDGWEVDDNYFLNVIKMKRFKARKHLTRLWYGNDENPLSTISLDESPLGSKSSYNYITNTVHADLGLFWPPLFIYSDNIPSHAKYGFSSTLAREMGRAFDIKGVFYDGAGQRFEQIFWPSSMEERYGNFLTCIRNQTESLNSKITKDVNSIEFVNNIIADLAAFLIPYEGLKSHLRSHLTEKPLPGVPLTKKQAFYVQTAQLFCELQSLHSVDPGTKLMFPPKYRVNGAVSNMEDFGDVFNCPPDSAMTSGSKCSLF